MNRSSLLLTAIATILTGAVIGLNIAPQETIAPVVPSNATLSSPEENPSLHYRLIDPNNFPVQYSEYDTPLPATDGENFIVANKVFKHEILTINLAFDSGVEYKANMEQGDSIVYTWRVKEGEVYFDMHGHPVNEESGFFTRYLEGEGSQNSGSIVAPYEGDHGWFLLNVSQHPIIIELEVAGFYNKLALVQE